MDERDLLMFGAGVGAGVTVLLAVLAWICRDPLPMPELPPSDAVLCDQCGKICGRMTTLGMARLPGDEGFWTCEGKIACHACHRKEYPDVFGSEQRRNGYGS